MNPSPLEDLRLAIRALADAESTASVQLARALRKAKLAAAQSAWGYESFTEYLAAEVRSHRVEHLFGLAKTAENLAALGILDRPEMDTIGISKARVLASSAGKDMAEELLAGARDMTVEDLRSALRRAKAYLKGKPPENVRVRFTVMLTEDQHATLIRGLRIVGEAADTADTGRQIELMAAEAIATWGNQCEKVTHEAA